MKPRFLLAGALAAALALGGPPVADASELRGRGLAPLTAGRPQPVNPLPSSILLFEDKQPLHSFDLDRGLSKLCRQGRFRQQRERLFTVRLGGFIHGAVIGQHWGLYDPEGLAVPNLVYALRWQDTGRCEVYVLRHLAG